MKVRYTLPALDDLDAVLAFVSRQSPQGAANIARSVHAIDRLLAEFPQAGVRTPLPWLRRIVASPYPYLIFYEIAETEIIVHAVRHAARDPKSMPDVS